MNLNMDTINDNKDNINITNNNELIHQNQPEDILIDKYINMIKKDKLDITEQIKSLLQPNDNINIETIIDKHLGIELEFNGLKTINTLSVDLKELSDSIMIKIDKEIYNKETCYNIYKEEVKNSLLRNQMEWYDTLSSNFIEEFIKEISTTNSKQNIDIIRKRLKEIMSKYKIKLNESYQEILKEYILSKILQMKKTIMESKITHFEYPRLKKYHQIIELSNYELIEENNTYYARNKETNEKSELIFDNIKLRSKDNKIIFIIDNLSKHQGYINNEKNISVVIQNNRIGIAINKDNPDDKTIITIVKKEDKYQFYYNNKIIRKLTNIEYILNIIEKYTKEIYQKLLLNELYKSLSIENNNQIDEDNIEEISLSNIKDNLNQEELNENKHSK